MTQYSFLKGKGNVSNDVQLDLSVYTNEHSVLDACSFYR